MARLLRVFRRSADETAPAPPPPRARRRAAPPVRELRRERRALERLRDERIRDLGGLVLEMYRQDSFREHLLYEQCSEVSAVDERLAEVDALLEARRPPAARCECGAPLFWGSRFCSNCGRPVAVEGQQAAAG